MASGADRQRSRRAGRRLALASVFEAEFGQRTATAVLERHLAETERDQAAAALARTIVVAAVEHRVEIDATITRLAPQYPVGTLARIDRAILRSAISEVLHSPTPARVAIAEWVELARNYSGEPMRRLANGVLGRIAGEAGGTGPPMPSVEEGASVDHVRATEEDRRRAARRRRGGRQA
jgi:N utilization substance protein B